LTKIDRKTLDEHFGRSGATIDLNMVGNQGGDDVDG